MITLYTRTSNVSSRKAKQWLIDHDILYDEKKITPQSTWEYEELQKILECTENGFDSIISKRSQNYPGNAKINKMSTHELLTYLIEHPYLIKFPIIIEHPKLVVGYSEEEIRVFITREERQMSIFDITDGLSKCKTLLKTSIDPTTIRYKVRL